MVILSGYWRSHPFLLSFWLNIRVLFLLEHPGQDMRTGFSLDKEEMANRRQRNLVDLIQQVRERERECVCVCVTQVY
jgi:hypothetical protein